MPKKERGTWPGEKVVQRAPIGPQEDAEERSAK